MTDFFNRFVSWVKKPYDENMDATGWFLLVGLVILAIVAWRSILSKVLD